VEEIELANSIVGQRTFSQLVSRMKAIKSIFAVGAQGFESLELKAPEDASEFYKNLNHIILARCPTLTRVVVHKVTSSKLEVACDGCAR